MGLQYASLTPAQVCEHRLTPGSCWSACLTYLASLRAVRDTVSKTVDDAQGGTAKDVPQPPQTYASTQVHTKSHRDKNSSKGFKCKIRHNGMCG